MPPVPLTWSNPSRDWRVPKPQVVGSIPTGGAMKHQVGTHLGQRIQVGKWGCPNFVPTIHYALSVCRAVCDSSAPRTTGSSGSSSGVIRYPGASVQLTRMGEIDARFEPGLTSGPHRPDGFYDGDPIELKPDSPSGRRSGERQLRRYMEKFDRDKGYLLYYDKQGAIRVGKVMYR